MPTMPNFGHFDDNSFTHPLRTFYGPWNLEWPLRRWGSAQMDTTAVSYIAWAHTLPTIRSRFSSHVLSTIGVLSRWNPSSNFSQSLCWNLFLYRCTAHWKDLDGTLGTILQCPEHTEQLKRVFDHAGLWNEYGVVSDVEVRVSFFLFRIRRYWTIITL